MVLGSWSLAAELQFAADIVDAWLLALYGYLFSVYGHDSTKGFPYLSVLIATDRGFGYPQFCPVYATAIKAVIWNGWRGRCHNGKICYYRPGKTSITKFYLGRLDVNGIQILAATKTALP